MVFNMNESTANERCWISEETASTIEQAIANGNSVVLHLIGRERDAYIRVSEYNPPIGVGLAIFSGDGCITDLNNGNTFYPLSADTLVGTEGELIISESFEPV